MNQTKRRIDLRNLLKVKKGVQTDVLKRGSGNQYRKHAFFSLLFEGEDERSLDLEVVGGDVQQRDKLLYGFNYVVMKNQEVRNTSEATNKASCKRGAGY